MPILFTQKQALEYLNISRMTLLRWEEKKLIEPIRLKSGHRRYPKEQLDQLLGIEDYKNESNNKTCVIYSRVSTKKQQLSGNLERQTNRLVQYAKDNEYQVLEVYEEVASGINENRRQLIRLMKKVSDEDVDIVLAEYKDRIARFGYEYIKRFCKSHKATIELIEHTKEKTLNEEMVEDMISIITSFSARLYGQRGAKKIKNKLMQLEKEK